MRTAAAVQYSRQTVLGAELAIIFYVLGSLVTGAGALWVWISVVAASKTDAGGVGALSGLILSAPGAYAMFSGLLILAVGGVLSRLDRIVENTRRTTGDPYVDTSRWRAADRAAHDAALSLSRTEPPMR